MKRKINIIRAISILFFMFYGPHNTSAQDQEQDQEQYQDQEQTQEQKSSLRDVAGSDFIDISGDSWVLREAFFAQEYNTDVVNYSYVLSSDCSFETGDDEFKVKEKGQYFSEIRRNRNRVYRIMTAMTNNDIKYDFKFKGFIFPKGTNVWGNDYSEGGAGNFFFEKGSYIPISEIAAKNIRVELGEEEAVKISADVRVLAVNEWEEKQKLTEYGKRWASLLGASSRDVNRTWKVKHREVILKPIRYRFMVNEKKVYDVAILSEDDKARMRSVEGSPADYNAWSNVPGAELTVEAYIQYHKYGVSSLAAYQEVVQLGITAVEIASILQMGKTVDDLKTLKQNGIEISELADMQKAGGNLDELIVLKKNGLTIEDYASIISGKGTLSDYMQGCEAGCKDISEYLRSITMQLSVDKYAFLCRQGVALDDYQKLSANNTTFEEYKAYSELKAITMDDFIRLKQEGISLDMYGNWSPYIDDVEDYKRAGSYNLSDLKAYHQIYSLNFKDYAALKEASVSLQLYQEWCNTANSVQQYPMISKYEADQREYRWFQTFGKTLDDYLSELRDGWRESINFKEYKSDLHKPYIHPRWKTSLLSFIAGGACVGTGFILRSMSKTYYDNSMSSFNSYREKPDSSTWSEYVSDYDTYKYMLRGGDILFYTAGGLVIFSGYLYLKKESNPHYISKIIDKNLLIAFDPVTSGIKVTLYFEGGSR